MKTIDIKSLLIGGLLASTILLGIAAVPYDASKHNSGRGEWDDKQEWSVKMLRYSDTYLDSKRELRLGYEPFAVTDRLVHYRKRIK